MYVPDINESKRRHNDTFVTLVFIRMMSVLNCDCLDHVLTVLEQPGEQQKRRAVHVAAEAREGRV